MVILAIVALALCSGAALLGWGYWHATEGTETDSGIGSLASLGLGALLVIAAVLGLGYTTWRARRRS